MGQWLSMPDLSSTDVDNASQLSVIDDKQKALQQQALLSHYLRNGRATDHGTMAGNIYIPPNPVNGAIDIYDRLKGIHDSQTAVAGLNALAGQKQGLTHDMIAAYLKQRLPIDTTFDPDSVQTPQMPDIQQ